MSDAVFEVYNDRGSLQFSIVSQIPSVVAKGTHSTDTNTSLSNSSGWRGTRLDIDGLSESAFIAVVPANSQNLGFQYVERVGSVNRYHFYTQGPSTTFDWYAFDFPKPGASTGVVFETYDSNGALLWQLTAQPAIASAFFNQAINENFIGGASVPIPSGRKYAIAFGMRAGYGYFDQVSTPDGQKQRYAYRYMIDCVKNDGTTLTVAPQLVDQSNVFNTDPGSANYRDYFSPRNDMILDVTSF